MCPETLKTALEIAAPFLKKDNQPAFRKALLSAYLQSEIAACEKVIAAPVKTVVALNAANAQLPVLRKQLAAL